MATTADLVERQRAEQAARVAETNRKLAEAREANAALDAMSDDEWNDHAREERRSRESVRVLETLATLDIGCCVWSKPVVEGDTDIARRGGLVVGITETDERDLDTGQVRRAFLTATWHHGHELRYETIAEYDVDAALCEPPNLADVRAFVRKLGTEIGASKGVWTSQLADYWDLGGRLIRAVLT